MGLDPQTQGDARTKKNADVCNGYLPTELANEEEHKMGCGLSSPSRVRVKTPQLAKRMDG
jgi:hypothetical protein